MMAKRYAKNRLVRAVFGCFFGIISMLGLVSPMMGATNVYAEPETGTVSGGTLENSENVTDAEQSGAAQNNESGDGAAQSATEGSKSASCESSLGALGWLVCPTTGVLSKAVDWLYEKIEGILVINPVEMKDGSPVYEIWKYMRGITNIVFIIFLLVVIYSQITGIGITNYGIKKVLPKLIVAAVLVNLSFIICSLLVDASNIVGAGLRGIFTNIQEATAATTNMHPVAMSDVYLAMSDGAALTIGGGLVAFELGAIWMLIPTVLGAIVAVAIGLVTIALRQAVVVLLIMIAPLAVVAYMLPNTEQWFKKWKQLLYRMLIFYPMFSLLFGASQLAGWAIIMAAKDGFGVILGIAVQIFPLFFAVSLMKMSGTFLSGINAGLTRLASGPLMVNRGWAQSRRDLTRARNLASGNVYTPTLRLQQFLSDRRIMREEETKEHLATVRNRGIAYSVMRNYNKDGTLSKEGERAFEDSIRNINYARTVEWHKNNFEEGVGGLGRNNQQTARLKDLDRRIVEASDKAKAEKVRGELIGYRNAVGYHERMEAAIDAHMDEVNGYKTDPKTGELVRRTDYKFHFENQPQEAQIAKARYDDISKIMGGNEYDVQYAAAAAAQARDSQQKIHDNRLQKYAELLPPTRDVEYRLKELIDAADKFSGDSEAIKNIDAIISFMRVLNQRGDTDLVAKGIYQVLGHGLELGTHASQALAGFSMFEVNNNDPFLKRFGKYINLETAQVFNKNKRKNRVVTLDEFVTGQYEEDDPENPGQKIIRYSKRPMAILMEGTTLDGIERTALDDGDMIMRHAYLNEDGKLDAEGIRKFFNKRNQIDTAMEPQFISACLKYVSGSEQLKSAVRYKTGYGAEMMVDENGQVYTDENGDPLYEWKAVWEKGKDDNPYYDDVEYAKEYFRSHTVKYLLNQTPIQILNLRSDFYDGLREHLSNTFLMNKDDDLTSEELQAKREFEVEKNRIETKYGKNPVGQEKVLRDKEMKKATHKIAGVQLRKMLEDVGTLEQVYRSRRSGAANSAKPWVRDWLGLDNEVAIKDYEAKKRAERKRERMEQKKRIEKAEQELRDKSVEENGAAGDDATPGLVRQMVYDEDDRDRLRDYISDLWQDAGDDDEEFYKEALSYLVNELSPDSYIVNEFVKRCKDDPAAGSHDMREWILELLDDLENY